MYTAHSCVVLYLVKGVDVWRETSMHAKDLVVDQRSQGEVVEDLRAVPPHVDSNTIGKDILIQVPCSRQTTQHGKIVVQTLLIARIATFVPLTFIP